VSVSGSNPVSDCLGGRLELAGKLGRLASGTNQFDHLAPELRRVGSMGFGHGDTSRESFVDVHRDGANPNPDTWHLDEVFLRINGVLHYLWRAVDQHGVVLDILVQSRRNASAACV